MKCRLLLVLIIMMPIVCFAQRVSKVKGTATYVVPQNVTLEQARITVLERAMLQAIADEFGTVVSQSNTSYIDNNSEVSNNFFSLSASEVKGEWVSTIGKPKYEQGFTEDGSLWVTCTVEGKAREIKNATVEFVAKTLCNGTEERNASSDFVSGDDMFLYFRSPQSGYLAVYLVNPNVGEAYCILPYSNSDSGAYQIVGDKPYVFFSQKDAQSGEIVEEYNFTCDSNMERNELYVVFSPTRFTKGLTDTHTESLLRTMSWSDFQSWLGRLKIKDKDLQTLHLPIIIKGK